MTKNKYFTISISVRDYQHNTLQHFNHLFDMPYGRLHRNDILRFQQWLNDVLKEIKKGVTLLPSEPTGTAPRKPDSDYIPGDMSSLRSKAGLPPTEE